MERLEIKKNIRRICVLAGFALGFAAMPAFADGAAAIAPADSRAHASFQKFAQSWMDKVHRMAKEQKPTARPGAGNTMVTYREYGDDFTVELRPTGHAKAPYVGILRYSEQIFSCRGARSGNCTMSSQIPVTEIFRFQDGRWIY